MTTIYLISQVKKNEGPENLQKMLKQILRASPKESLDRVYYYTNSAPKFTAEVLAEQLGDMPSDGRAYRVAKSGTTKGNTTIPLREDLRRSLYPGDYIAFDKVPGEEEEGEKAGIRGIPLLVENVYAQSLEIEHPGLLHRVTGTSRFRLMRCHRSVASSLMDSSKVKNAVGFVRHQDTGSVFILTHGSICEVLPRLLSGLSGEDSADQCPDSAKLVQLLRKHKRPYCVQLTWDSEDCLPDRETLKVFHAGGYSQPLQKPRRGVLIVFILLLMVLAVVAFAFVNEMTVDDVAEKFKDTVGKIRDLAQS